MPGTLAPRYVIISPVKNEARYVELTLRSVIAQTVRPVAWIIVDDGSTDNTRAIVSQYASRHPFIRIVDSGHVGARRPGGAVIRAFNAGLQALGPLEYDFIVKLDCDLSFQQDYFERLLVRFGEDDRLGIASGVYLESDDTDVWKAVWMPAYHAFGASKVVRRECFEDIGGFVTAAGWDTVDEIRAWHKGWQTAHFSSLPVRHHKREGSGIGQVRTSRMHGEIFYVTGGDPLFLCFKVIHRFTRSPLFISGCALLVGYAAAALSRKPKLVSQAEARRYRRVLRERLTGRMWPARLNPAQSHR